MSPQRGAVAVHQLRSGLPVSSMCSIRAMLAGWRISRMNDAALQRQQIVLGQRLGDVGVGTAGEHVGQGAGHDPIVRASPCRAGAKPSTARSSATLRGRAGQADLGRRCRRPVALRPVPAPWPWRRPAAGRGSS